jgi:hypothetical protein
MRHEETRKERHQEFRIFKLDATDDPPSRLDVIIHDN